MNIRSYIAMKACECDVAAAKETQDISKSATEATGNAVKLNNKLGHSSAAMAHERAAAHHKENVSLGGPAQMAYHTSMAEYHHGMATKIQD